MDSETAVIYPSMTEKHEYFEKTVYHEVLEGLSRSSSITRILYGL